MTDDARPRDEAPENAAREIAPAAMLEGPPLAPGEGADLLSIGLLVFFVALLLVVLALLALPLLVG